jgi:hypothetical protein
MNKIFARNLKNNSNNRLRMAFRNDGSSHINKKGNFLTDNIGSFLLALAVALIGLYLIWAYILHGGGDSIGAAQKCGAITGSRGECKLSCDVNLEMEFENMGCEKRERCCVLIDADIRDVILPSGYGGNTEYDFDIESISVNLPECQEESGSQNGNSWICAPRRSYKIPVQIEVINTGNNNIKASAVPVVVVSGNSDLVKPVGTYTGKEEDIGSGGAGTLFVEVGITSNDAKDGNYITIYPYAKCETRQCKRTDERSRGILEKMPDGSDEFIIIKFVSIP